MSFEGKICVCVSEPSVSGLLLALRGLSFAEVRLDGLEKKPRKEEIAKIFSSGIPLIATCRPGKLSEEERKEIMLQSIQSGAKYVDLEVENKPGFNSGIVAAAKKKGCKVIVSCHNYEKTPPEAELEKIIGRCFESGADIAKIACKVETEADCARLLGLLDSTRKLVVVGMGKKGRIVRIAAPLLGSPFTYASAGKGKETAGGQMDEGKMKEILRALA